MDKASARKTLDALGPALHVTNAQVELARERLADAGTASPPPSHVPAQPPGPPRRTGSLSLIGADGVVYDDVPGAGYQPRTRFGLEVTDTSPGGQALTHTSPGLLPARLPGGPLVTGPGGSCFTHVRP